MITQTVNQGQIGHLLAEAIQSSRGILNLADDWDEEGSPAYKEATWNRAVELVEKAALAFDSRFGVWVDPPRLLPGPEGSIDIHWKTAGRELLINVPEADEEPADYYGCGGLQDAIKGKLDTSSPNERILPWLTK